MYSVLKNTHAANRFQKTINLTRVFRANISGNKKNMFKKKINSSNIAMNSAMSSNLEVQDTKSS